MRIFPIELDVSHIEHSLECAPGKFEAELMTDKALCSVAGDQVFRVDGFRLAIRGIERGGNGAFVLREAGQLRPPTHVTAGGSYVLVKQSLMLALLDDQQERVWA